MSLIAVYVDGFLCETTFEVPNIEPDAHAMRLYGNLANAAQEQLIMACDNPNTDLVDRWLRTFGLKFSITFHCGDLDDSRKRMEKLIKFGGAQQAKLTLFVGGRFVDCNHMADLGVPSLRYLAPNSAAAWQPDQRSSWQQAVAKQGGE